MKFSFSQMLLIPVVAVLAAPFQACNTTKKVAACPDNVACTMVYSTIGVYVTDAGNKPVLFDESYTINLTTGEIIHPQPNNVGIGYYTVLDDGYRKKLQNRTDRFQFVGIKNNQRVVEELYTLSADCCHVSKVSGRAEIVMK